MDFFEFLHAAGMFIEDKVYQDFSDDEKEKAKSRYIDALSAGVQGTAMVVLKREVKHIFINAYNKKIMQLFQANHDLQIQNLQRLVKNLFLTGSLKIPPIWSAMICCDRTIIS